MLIKGWSVSLETNTHSGLWARICVHVIKKVPLGKPEKKAEEGRPRGGSHAKVLFGFPRAAQKSATDWVASKARNVLSHYSKVLAGT